MVPSVIAISQCFPVRLSVIVSVSLLIGPSCFLFRAGLEPDRSFLPFDRGAVHRGETVAAGRRGLLRGSEPRTDHLERCPLTDEEVADLADHEELRTERKLGSRHRRWQATASGGSKPLQLNTVVAMRNPGSPRSSNSTSACAPAAAHQRCRRRRMISRGIVSGSRRSRTASSPDTSPVTTP